MAACGATSAGHLEVTEMTSNAVVLATGVGAAFALCVMPWVLIRLLRMGEVRT